MENPDGDAVVMLMMAMRRMVTVTQRSEIGRMVLVAIRVQLCWTLSLSDIFFKKSFNFSLKSIN